MYPHFAITVEYNFKRRKTRVTVTRMQWQWQGCGDSESSTGVTVPTFCFADSTLRLSLGRRLLPWLHARLPMAHLGIWHKGMGSTDRINALLVGKDLALAGTHIRQWNTWGRTHRGGLRSTGVTVHATCTHECTRTNLPETVDFHRIVHKSALCSRKRSS